MTPLTYEQIAATILAEIRAIYPNGRKKDPAITASWARVLERGHLVLPAAVWKEAVTTWSVSHSEPPTPHDLIATAKQVRDQWQSDPRRQDDLEAWRIARLRSREAAGELPPGTAPVKPSGAGPDHREALAAWRHQWANRTRIIGSETRLPAIEHDPDEVPRQVVPDD